MKSKPTTERNPIIPNIDLVVATEDGVVLSVMALASVLDASKSESWMVVVSDGIPDAALCSIGADA